RNLLSLLIIPAHTAVRWALTAQNNFFYHSYLKGNGSKEIHFSGLRLHVDASRPSVVVARGDNATIPCRFWYEPELTAPREVRVKWTWQAGAGGLETEVLVATGSRTRSSEGFGGRVHLRQDFPGDAALMMTAVMVNETGRYRCEVVDGLEDKSVSVDLELYGVVFPYQHSRGRYRLSFLGAQQACEEQGATLATLAQLLQSWKEGLNWCNVGWLADGTVRYPITRPRVACGGPRLPPGIRSYGRRHPNLHRYDVFCFFSSLGGKVFFLQQSEGMNQTEARRSCQESGADVAKVGQLYAAWKFAGLDRCDAGWLADGSVRYPITAPRPNCGPSEPGVRSFGFPPPQLKYGVYCYQSE
uniref:Hyaluronan and proteoglycan link protein 3 n=1 Tax=Tetraodon nigroviridis TaxID=99883 RepID=H3CVX9_TETNG